MDRLKSATAAAHKDAESRRLQRDMVAGRLSADRYGAWAGQMYLVHSALEETLRAAATRSDAVAAVVQDGGLHVRNLASDIRAMGRSPENITPLPSTTNAIAGIHEIASQEPIALLGVNYVLEGSMNGNRFIARAMARHLPRASLSYLDPYGDSQSETWQGYRNRMNATAFSDEETEAIVRAAKRMFGFVTEISDELA
jgi:heme oxygenase